MISLAARVATDLSRAKIGEFELWRRGDERAKRQSM
jgi:hypothetical protein